MFQNVKAQADGNRDHSVLGVPETLTAAVADMRCVLNELSEGQFISAEDIVKLIVPLKRSVNRVNRLMAAQPSAATPEVARGLRALVDRFCTLEGELEKKQDIGVLEPYITRLTLAEAIVEEKIHYWACHGR